MAGGGGKLSRCCRHVAHLSMSTKTTKAMAAQGIGRRVFSTATISLDGLSPLRGRSSNLLSVSLRPSCSSASHSQWPSSTGTTLMSTSNKPAPVQPSSTPTNSEVGNTEGNPPAPGVRAAYPERLVIYHAGTGKIIFLASLKLTTIFAFALFDLYAFPTFLAGAAPLQQTATVALSGLIPLLWVSYTTSPFVTTIHMNVPHFARGSATALERFAKNIPPNTKLDLTTLSLIGKPRTSSSTVGDLYPTKKRFGLVNYSRDTTAANAARKWWRFRAVGDFMVQRGNEKRLPKTGWVWKVISDVIERRAAASQSKVQAK